MNIIGFYDPHGGIREIESLLKRQADEAKSPYAAFQVILPPFGARCDMHCFMEPEEQPFISEDRRYYALAEGELYETPTGEKSLKYLLEHFVRRGEEGWEGVNGQFVVVIYDRSAQRLYLINDRYGFRQCYYCWKEGQFLFGSQIKSVMRLMGRSVAFSLRGIAELMLVGHHFGESTLFEGIHAMPPAAIVCLDGGGLQVERYWRVVYEPDPGVRAEELAERLGVAVERQLKGGGHKGILLSGGMDSRAVAYEAARRDSSVVAFTHGERMSRDVNYAEQVCARLGIEHHILEFEPEQWKASIPQVVWQTEGEAGFHHYKSIQFHPFMKQHCDTLLTGLVGDPSRASFDYSPYFAEMPIEVLADHAFQRSLAIECQTDSIQKTFDQDLRNEMISSAREANARALASNKNRIGVDIIDAWTMENRQKRFTFVGPSSDRCLFHIRTPFLDYDFADYWMKIPALIRYEGSLYRKALWQCMPELRDIPKQKTGKPPFPDKRTAFLWSLSHPVAALACRRQPYEKFFVSFARLLRECFAGEEMKALLCCPGLSWQRFFDLREVESAIENHFAQREDQSTLIAKLLTLHYAEKLFLEGSHKAESWISM